jgi:DNA mismatch repair protein MutS
LTPPPGCAAAAGALAARRTRRAGARRRRHRHGFDAELDELRAIQTNCDGFLLDLETREKPAPASPTCGCSSTRCTASTSRSPRARLDKVPDDYRRRQTLKNAERFITPELKAFEDKALSAQERALAREKWLYEQLLDRLQAFVPALTQLARAWPRWTRCARWPSARSR